MPYTAPCSAGEHGCHYLDKSVVKVLYTLHKCQISKRKKDSKHNYGLVLTQHKAVKAGQGTPLASKFPCMEETYQSNNLFFWFHQ